MIVVDAPLRLLVLDAYPREDREGLARAGATPAGSLWRRVLQELEPTATVDLLCPADADASLPVGVDLSAYDGVVWSGSSLTIHVTGDPRVERELALARAIRAAGRPSFGSCWGAQLAAVVAGGRCAANPRGREFGIARSIRLTEAGRAHPLYEGKAAEFVAFTSHSDEVVEMPEGVPVLASNPMSRVQGLAVERPAAFWAVQYHPEFDLREIAALCVYRRAALLAEGLFADEAAIDRFIEGCRTLHDNPERRDLAAQLGLDATILDPRHRRLEIRNWLRCLGERGTAS